MVLLHFHLKFLQAYQHQQVNISTLLPTMPPRLSLRLFQPVTSQATQINISSFLVPFLQTQIRHASILNQLSDNPAAYKNKKRVGRGPSSGKGKTAGRGQKGQKARGKVPAHFVGGQTREEVTHGKYGFKNVYAFPTSTSW